MPPLNPFNVATDLDRHAIWRVLILDDSEAFIAHDFARIEADFDADNFEGLRCNHSPNPADWIIAFPTLAAYRENWLEGAKKFTAISFKDVSPLDALYFRCKLNRIDIAGGQQSFVSSDRSRGGRVRDARLTFVDVLLSTLG